MLTIIERARLKESMRTFRRRIMTSGPQQMQKVEGSVAKIRKPLAPKTAVKKMASPNSGSPMNESRTIAGKLMESRANSRHRIIDAMLKKISAARAAKKPNPGNAGGEMSIFGKAGVTVVDPRNMLAGWEKRHSKRELVNIRKIMHSDRSIVGRGILRESMDASKGYARGAPIIKTAQAAAAYDKNRLLTKGKLKTSVGSKVAGAVKQGADMINQARKAVQTGTVASRAAKASEKVARAAGSGTAPGSRFAHLTGGGPF